MKVLQNFRLKLISLLFVLVFLALSVRLFFWQVIKGGELSSQAQGQYSSGKSISAPRGNIMAADGTWLSARGEAYLVFAEIPKLEADLKEIANKLAIYFVEDPSDRGTVLSEVERLEGLLSRREAVWVALKQKVSPEVRKKIESDNISGIGFEKVEDRIYPEASSAAHLLGFLGKDEEGNNKGYFGLEGYYDLTLTGKPGFLSQEKDAAGRPIFVDDASDVSEIEGIDLITHIDKTVQHSLEEKLLDGIEKYGAKGGTAIVMNPATGAILGMSSFPSYDPEKYYQFSNELFKNPAVSEIFEPGSVFKIIIMASALDAKVVKPDTICDKCSGPLKVDKYTIETWNNEYNPDSTMTDVIVHSDNVGMAFVGEKIGSDKLYDYLIKFGIGKPTGVDLQGEVTPKLREKGTWNVVDLATASFGQGVALTPIQMIRAAGVIANRGVITTPQVVGTLTSGTWRQDIKPQSSERVISESASNEIKDMMVEAAKNGEAKWTHLRGFRVAGKTGTAQIPISGHYDEESTIASFVGFAPSENPKFVMLVTLREPQSSPWASETAAPLWYSIAKDLFAYFGIQPEN